MINSHISVPRVHRYFASLQKASIDAPKSAHLVSDQKVCVALSHSSKHPVLSATRSGGLNGKIQSIVVCIYAKNSPHRSVVTHC